MTACGISVKAPFLSAEFSTYIYCLSSNLSLTESDICPTVDWSCLPVPQNYMRHYLNSVQVGKAQFSCPLTLCGCWRQPSCWNQTILFSPELPSWRKEEDNLFSLRLLMHPNPNLAPALIFFFAGLQHLWWLLSLYLVIRGVRSTTCPKVVARGWWIPGRRKHIGWGV